MPHRNWFTPGDTFVCGVILLLVWLIASNVWIGIFLLSGLILGIAYAVVKDLWDGRFEAVSSFRNHPILTTIAFANFGFLYWLLYYTMTELSENPQTIREDIGQMWVGWWLFHFVVFPGFLHWLAIRDDRDPWDDPDPEV